MVAVIDDGVPSSSTLLPPSRPCVRLHRCQPMGAVRDPIPTLSPPEGACICIVVHDGGAVRCGVAAGGIVLIWRGVTTPVNTPNHCDTVSI